MLSRLILFIGIILTIVAGLRAQSADELLDNGINADTFAPTDFCVGDTNCQQQDRIWLISTRHLTSNACSANLESPDFRVSRLDCGMFQPQTLAEFESQLQPSRQLVIYVHGNRMESGRLPTRSMTVYRNIRRCRDRKPIDWLVFSWPSAKEGKLLKDFRLKADRAGAHSLYLAWLLRRQVQRGLTISMIGYSYGALVSTGALHALAGGPLCRRALPGEHIVGANIGIGMLAPAVSTHWLLPNGYHGRATQNWNNLVMVYSSRDAVLKRFWLLDGEPTHEALGYTGPRCFALRADGTPLQVRSRDCRESVGLAHAELMYYHSKCNAAVDLATLINDRNKLVRF